MRLKEDLEVVNVEVVVWEEDAMGAENYFIS